jgi:hypothetical protein
MFGVGPCHHLLRTGYFFMTNNYRIAWEKSKNSYYKDILIEDNNKIYNMKDDTLTQHDMLTTEFLNSLSLISRLYINEKELFPQKWSQFIFPDSFTQRETTYQKSLIQAHIKYLIGISENNLSVLNKYDSSYIIPAYLTGLLGLGSAFAATQNKEMSHVASLATMSVALGCMSVFVYKKDLENTHKYLNQNKLTEFEEFIKLEALKSKFP